MKGTRRWILAGGLSLILLQGCVTPLDVAMWTGTNLYQRRVWKNDEISTEGAYLVRKDNFKYEFTLNYIYFTLGEKKVVPATLTVYHKGKKLVSKESFVEMKLQDAGGLMMKVPVPHETTYYFDLPVRLKTGDEIVIQIATQKAMAEAVCKVGDIGEKIACNHKSVNRTFGNGSKKEDEIKENS